MRPATRVVALLILVVLCGTALANATGPVVAAPTSSTKAVVPAPASLPLPLWALAPYAMQWAAEEVAAYAAEDPQQATFAALPADAAD